MNEVYKQIGGIFVNIDNVIICFGENGTAKLPVEKACRADIILRIEEDPFSISILNIGVDCHTKQIDVDKKALAKLLLHQAAQTYR